MGERVRAINKYYTDIEYNSINLEQVLTKIVNLSNEIKNKGIKNLSERFFNTATIIEANLFYFVSICKHVDVVTAIVEYLKYYGAEFILNQDYDEAEYAHKEHYIPMSLMLTVFSMCGKKEIILFLERAIIDDSALIMSEIFFYYIKIIINSNQNNDMILLEDSDLYAVINCLMIIDDFKLNKIWIQESIKQKFLMLSQKYLNCLKCSIYTFRSQKELLTLIGTSHGTIMNIISIWSENVVAAKNLASCLDRDILFINTHMDFNGGVLFVPFAKIIDNLMDHIIMNSIDKTNSHIHDIEPCYKNIKIDSEDYQKSSAIYNLFYDGMWQKPVEGIYWKHNNEIFAHATNEDIRKCVKSAEKGFEVWHAVSVASRIEVLFALVETLEYNGHSLLSALVSRCIQFVSLYENSNGHCARDEKSELIITRKSKGIIILKEENENTLFFRLTQSLLAGNSVIVIFNENFYNIAPYFNIFATSNIPPGVINMLSNKKITDLESRLCGTQYSTYIKRFFSGGNLIEKCTKSYTQLSLPKQVVHPLK
ncbi:uncharacterized protein LOC126853942 [Cataglyphis hispanica]|uniref:uncharacterized protein LOC126853942 n=1 Tax=Cataglyphis hispanica TaxID=1086592 RepID=UPI0021807199|nr:uncharacterized protein LOC126853942 [Cataglyphis hispanica]